MAEYWLFLTSPIVSQLVGQMLKMARFILPVFQLKHVPTIDDRTHVSVVQRTGEAEVAYIIANVYAPNPNSNDKINFFQRVFDSIINELRESFNCNALLVQGDLNLNFHTSEMKNRAYTAEEKRISSIVKERQDECDLEGSNGANCKI